MRQVINRAFRWGIFGLIGGPAITFCLMLFALYFDEACRTGGICQLDIALNIALSVPGGFVAFFLFGLYLALRARARESET